MSGNEQYRPRVPPLPVRVVMLQLGAVALAALLAAVWGRGAAVAVLLGGGCACVPNAWMALRVSLTSAPGGEVRSAIGLMLAMVAKLGMMVALLALAWWHNPGGNAAAFFAGFIVALLTHHGSLLLDD